METIKKISEMLDPVALVRTDQLAIARGGDNYRVAIPLFGTGPTLLVAASDASVLMQAMADYLCDGTNDEVQIQAAIDALPASGGVVQLSEGTFTVNEVGASELCIQIDRSNVTLNIPNGATIILADNELSDAEICNIIKVGNESDTYENIQIVGGGIIDGNSGNNSSTGSITEGALIWITANCASVLIKDLIVKDGVRGGIFLGGTPGNELDHIIVKGCIVDGCAEGIFGEFAANVWIELNEIKNTTEQDGVEPASGSSYWWIKDNKISGIDSSASAIDVFTWSTTIKSIVISGNHIVNNGSNFDINIGTSSIHDIDDVVITDNILEGGGIAVGWATTGIHTSIVISNNIIEGAGKHGIDIGADARNLTTTGNLVRDCGAGGIVVGGLSDALIIGNSVLNNGQDDGYTDYERSGIITYGTRATIVGNTVYDDQGGGATQQNGIMAYDSTEPIIVGNNCGGNVIKDYDIGSINGTPIIEANQGLVYYNQGAELNVNDGGTIAHGMVLTPTMAVCTPSVAGEMVSVTALGAANITVAIKKHDNTPGTQQTIYWLAKI